MIPKQPPKKTATRPGLGTDDGVPRLDSAELQKVRGSSGENGEKKDKSPNASPTPPPSSRARVPREDEDESGPISMPRSDQFIVTPRTPAQPFSPNGRTSGLPRTPTGQAFKPMGSTPTAPQSFKPAGQSFKAGSTPTAPQSFKPMASPAAQKAAKTTGSWGDEAQTGQRARKAVTVDSVGDAATRIARTTRQTSPKVIASAATIASAPLDSRTAFVLSLVDGTSSVPAIVDASGLAEDEIIGILARLARLGLISVP